MSPRQIIRDPHNIALLALALCGSLLIAKAIVLTVVAWRYGL